MPVSALVNPGAPTPIAATRSGRNLRLPEQLLRALNDLPDDAFGIAHIRGRRGHARSDVSVSIGQGHSQIRAANVDSEKMCTLGHIIVSAVIYALILSNSSAFVSGTMKRVNSSVTTQKRAKTPKVQAFPMRWITLRKLSDTSVLEMP